MTTVQDIINSRANGSCSTSTVEGLSHQIIAMMNVLVKDVLVRFDDLKVECGPAVNPYLQPRAKEALSRAIKARGVPLKINSCYRTIAQQFILWSWYRNGGVCGIPLAATPGNSNHEDGLAIDTPDYSAWNKALSAQGWTWLGARDTVHFSYTGGGVRDDIGEIGVKAFQHLWNKNNPNDPIGTDGIFGPNTARRLALSPINGFTSVDGAPIKPPLAPTTPAPNHAPTASVARLLRLTTPLMNGEDVKEIQIALIKLGLLAQGEADGKYGQRTEKAVVEFQQERGLSADGIVGTQTLKQLDTTGPYAASPATAIKASISSEDARWLAALKGAPTSGASAVTARQDGLPPGIASSYHMAQLDLKELLPLAKIFAELGDLLDLPPALIAALASRESRAGKALDVHGYGDHGNAFGILQVDKRYHQLNGTNSPTSKEHIEQGARVLATARAELSKKYPTWGDNYILKGAIAAYNSGVNNIRTQAGIDVGTTGNDYSSDVIARAHFYLNKL